jgi:hypothetical protein
LFELAFDLYTIGVVLQGGNGEEYQLLEFTEFGFLDL